MHRLLQPNDRPLTFTDIIPLLTRYQMLPQFLEQLTIDRAIAAIDCTPEETAVASEAFWQQQKMMLADDRQGWLDQHRMNLAEFELMVTRSRRIEKFKQAKWQHKLHSYFLQRKAQLDQVVYSLLRLDDSEMIQELYYRIEAQECSFADLARQYSQGPEALTGGLTGPVELNRLPRLLADMLANSQPGQLWGPMKWGEDFIILRLEQYLPTQYDEAMRQTLLNELFQTWLQHQLKTAPWSINNSA